MTIGVKIMLLALMVRMVLSTEKPLLCAGIYAGAIFLLDVVFSVPFLSSFGLAAIVFLVAAVYFWLLERLDSRRPAWWCVLFFGVPILLL